MTLQFTSGTEVTIGPHVDESMVDWLGQEGVIERYVGSTQRGNYYQVRLTSGDQVNLYASEMRVYLPEVSKSSTKKEKAARLKKELADLEAEIADENRKQAKQDVVGLPIASLIEIGVDDDSSYVVKVGKNKWKWFSKCGDPLAHDDTTDDAKVIAEIEQAKQFGYHQVFPANED